MVTGSGCRCNTIDDTNWMVYFLLLDHCMTFCEQGLLMCFCIEREREREIERERESEGERLIDYNLP